MLLTSHLHLSDLGERHAASTQIEFKQRVSSRPWGNLLVPSLGRIATRLDQIQDLPDNWDGYGASRVTEIIIQRALKTIEKLLSLGVPVEREDVAPGASGIISIYIERPTWQLELIIGTTTLGYHFESPSRGVSNHGVCEAADGYIPHSIQQDLLAILGPSSHPSLEPVFAST